MVGQKSRNRDGFVAEFNCLALWNVSRDLRESLVCGSDDGDVRGGGEGVCKTIDEAYKLQKCAEIWLGLEEGHDVALGEAGACHQDTGPE